jgi:hypothetical protein
MTPDSLVMEGTSQTNTKRRWLQIIVSFLSANRRVLPFFRITNIETSNESHVTFYARYYINDGKKK